MKLLDDGQLGGPKRGGTEDDCSGLAGRSETAITKTGDLYLLGDHRLVCGDSQELGVVAYAVDGTADLLFTDPPYGVKYQSHMAEGGTASRFEVIENDDLDPKALHEFLCAVFAAARASLRPGAAVYVFHADKVGIRIAFEQAFVGADFTLSATIIWVKNAGTMGWQDYRSQHEPILYGWKSGADRVHVEDRTETTVWEHARDAAASYVHPTQKPVALPARAIRNSTKPGDTVLDCFGGSGSTLIACEQMGRRGRLIEKDLGYCDVIVASWEKFTGRKATRIPAEGRAQ